MAVEFDAARGLSFAHLAGLAPVAAKADEDDKDSKAKSEGEDKDESDEDDKKSKKSAAKDGEDGEDGEDGDDGKDGEDGDDGDDGEDGEDGEDGRDGRDGKDGKDGKDAKRARSAERTRWATVLGAKSFAKNPALGARLLATTGLSASAIVGTLRDTQAAGGSSASNSRADRNPNVGTGAAAAPRAAGTTLTDRMLALRGKK